MPSSSRGLASDIITCGQCGTAFTGSYRRGNLGRHVRQKHGHASGRLYTCRAADCLHGFQRQDARLKHERKLHPELANVPNLPREQHEHISDTLEEAVANPLACPPSETARTWLCENENAHPGSFPEHHVEPFDNDTTLAYETLQTFTRLHATLTAEDYSLTCDTLCTRWEAIAQGLKLNE
jgi:hypothetical protein